VIIGLHTPVRIISGNKIELTGSVQLGLITYCTGRSRYRAVLRVVPCSTLPEYVSFRGGYIAHGNIQQQIHGKSKSREYLKYMIPIIFTRRS
jgi:hypothetical protein